MAVRMNIDISEELHQFLKIHTAYTKDTIKNFVTNAIYSKVDAEKELNAESIRVIEESLKGINLTTYSSIEEMYKDLEIDD